MNNFIFLGEWMENIAEYPVELQDQIIADIVRYGTGKDLCHEEDLGVSMAVNFTKAAIDRAKDNYANRVAQGLTHGRKKLVDDRRIWELWQENNKLRAVDIAEIIGCSKTSVEHSDGWRKRKEAMIFD